MYEREKFIPEDGISYWDLEDKDLKDIKNVDVPYTLFIETDGWAGNFERELIGYTFGILDGVQMNINFALEERILFWKEVFNKDMPIEFEDEYELYDKFFCKTFRCVDDWHQITFYDTDNHRIIIQFNEIPPNIDMYIFRIKDFFIKFSQSTKNAKLLKLYIVNNNKSTIERKW